VAKELKSEGRGQMTEVRGPDFALRATPRHAEGRSRKSECGMRKSEVGNGKKVRRWEDQKVRGWEVEKVRRWEDRRNRCYWLMAMCYWYPSFST